MHFCVIIRRNALINLRNLAKGNSLASKCIGLRVSQFKIKLFGVSLALMFYTAINHLDMH
jgi:hypothetical protein